ncbi:MAG: 4-(cytidine 5'-diphospho)-2-C-methyl-D-erythritol kinase [Defluviitaleaceae bacterium]|nr:4-(cytidine 5'-diphospho)-2-C-methyl-D-erythritol kinase [Defluviitaleaceae bacterium]
MLSFTPDFLQNPLLCTGGFVKVQAPAKINLFLDVLNKRNDGFHDISSVMQSISLCDELELSPNSEHLFVLECDNPSLPLDETNLIIKAARLLDQEYNLPHGINFKLTKKIPVGAGLAGGSSNAAAALLGINALFDLAIPAENLLKIGKSLGADVPFCLTGGTALVEGIGERITALQPHPPCCIVVACPNIFVSTREIFERANVAHSGENEIFGQANVARTDENETTTLRRKNFLQALKTNDPTKIACSLYNFFTPLTTSIHPQITEIINRFKKLGALGAQMSGTGSSVFAYFQDESTAKTALEQLRHGDNIKTFICTPIG